MHSYTCGLEWERAHSTIRWPLSGGTCTLTIQYNKHYIYAGINHHFRTNIQIQSENFWFANVYQHYTHTHNSKATKLCIQSPFWIDCEWICVITAPHNHIAWIARAFQQIQPNQEWNTTRNIRRFAGNSVTLLAYIKQTWNIHWN